jgi:hypothetical protein
LSSRKVDQQRQRHHGVGDALLDVADARPGGGDLSGDGGENTRPVGAGQVDEDQSLLHALLSPAAKWGILAAGRFSCNPEAA